MKKILLFIAFILVAGAVYFWFGASSVTKNTDAYIYDLPFKKGASYNVVQGYGGFFPSSSRLPVSKFLRPVSVRV